MFVCFMVFASVGHFSLDREVPQNSPHAGKAMIVFACLFILGFASTWGPIIWTIVAELYPSRYRSNAMALATASNWGKHSLLLLAPYALKLTFCSNRMELSPRFLHPFHRWRYRFSLRLHFCSLSFCLRYRRVPLRHRRSRPYP